jgi:hypothetical protein
MPIAPAPPRALGAAAPEAYAGDGICINFDGGSFWLRTGLGNIPMSMATLATITAYARMITGASDDEHNVYCEETKKHHRAVLIRELTLDEIYKGLK